jgi:hypothetical protein
MHEESPSAAGAMAGVFGDPLDLAARAVLNGVFRNLRDNAEARPAGVTSKDLAQWRAESWDDQVEALLGVMEPYRSQIVARLEGRPSLPPEMPEAWHNSERRWANIRAMELAARGGPWTDAERAQIARYSGWGGLSLKSAAPHFPPAFPVPTAAGLIHEYYTPLAVWQAVGELLWRPGSALVPFRMQEAPLDVLEPSAGIGRALRAIGMEGLNWTAVEASGTSATMLQAIAPAAHVHHGYFESWVAVNQRAEFDLVLANPPYGPRGESAELDPAPGFATKRAYLYFLYRTLSLLRKGGLGVYIIPTGFMTGTGAEMTRARERVLLRNHLVGAFRLPSIPDEGGTRADVAYDQFVVDVVLLRSRGGVLPELLPSDLVVAEGGYYEAHPGHVLGQPVGNPKAGEGGPKVRRGMQVKGTFRGFPAVWSPRTLEGEGQVQPDLGERKVARNRGGITRVDVKLDDLPPHVAEAVAIGDRVDAYLTALAANDEAALTMHRELVEDLQRWRGDHGAPERDKILKAAAAARSIGAQRFLSVFNGRSLNKSITQAPDIRPVYEGDLQPVPVAEWLYRRQGGRLTVDQLCTWWEAQSGVELDCAAALEELTRAGWAHDGARWDELVPARDYYTGLLWPKYDRAVAREAAAPDDARATAQAAKLRKLIGFRPGSSIVKECSPVDSWLPLDLVTEWVHDTFRRLHRGVVLERDEGLLRIQGKSYAWMDNTEKKRPRGLTRDFLSFIGWANRDKALWNPHRPQVIDPATGNKRQRPIDEVRREQAATWTQQWQHWLNSRESRLERLEEAYSRQLRGWVDPVYDEGPIELHRWKHARGWTLHPHQNGAVRKFATQGSLLLAFDVGVGKTLAGVGAVLEARQTGRARRPVVLVPNTLAWKWYRDFQQAAPSLRVTVIGSDRYEVEPAWKDGHLHPKGDVDDVKREWPRSRARHAAMRGILEAVDEFEHGVPVAALIDRYGSRVEKYLKDLAKAGLVEHHAPKGKVKAQPDTSEARAQKWTELQAGAWDVVILTYSALLRTQIDPAFVSRYVDQTVALRRSVRMAIKNEDEAKQSTEREQAVTEARVRGWVGEMLQPPKRWAYDPGIDWHALGIDMLVVDEAQNFKNLFFTERENAQKAAKQALGLDFRCASVREHTGGGGILLLSATPAKNSGVEFFTMLYLLNPRAWEQVGIDNHEAFVQRFGRWELCNVMDASGKKAVAREVLTGWQNIDELRSVIARWSIFKTAEEVGIPLPEVHLPPPVQVEATPAQRDALGGLYAQLAEVEESIKNAARMQLSAKNPGAWRALLLKKTGIAQRIYLTYVHPELPGIGDSKKAIAAATPADGPKLVACADRIIGTSRSSCQVTDGEEWCLGCGHIVFCDNPAVHSWMKRLLVDRGVPEERIAVLNALDTPDIEERQQIAERFNGNGRPGDPEYEPPAVDIVIANAVAYEGMDLQRRTCAIHHLDVPWEPATLQQRNGRGVRQGNTFDRISIYYYFVANSNESWRTQRIERKRGWMAELVAGQRRSTNTTGASSGCAPPPADDDDMAFARPEDRDRILAARAESRARVEQETRKQAQLDLNKILRVAVDDISRARRRLGGTKDHDAEAAQIIFDEAMEAVQGVLASAPADLYPPEVRWREQAERLVDPSLISSPLRRVAFVPDRGPLLWPGDVVQLAAKRPAMVGQPYVDGKGNHGVGLLYKDLRALGYFRPVGGHIAQNQDVVRPDYPVEVKEPGLSWEVPPAREFIDALANALRMRIEGIPTWTEHLFSDWSDLGWNGIPVDVQTEVWPILGEHVPDKLVRRSSYDRLTGVAVPVMGPDGVRTLSGSGVTLRGGEQIPAPTMAGWQRWQAAVRAGLHKDANITSARRASVYWWGWALPKNVKPEGAS